LRHSVVPICGGKLCSGKRNIGGGLRRVYDVHYVTKLQLR